VPINMVIYHNPACGSEDGERAVDAMGKRIA